MENNQTNPNTTVHVSIDQTSTTDSNSPTGSAPVPHPANAFLTGSQIADQKPPLPKGIYVIAGFCLLEFVIGFFDTSQTGIVYTIAILINLLLGIGLVLRISAARTIIVWFSGLLLVLSVVGLIFAAMLQGAISQNKANYQAAVSRIDQKRLTLTQKRQLNDLQAKIDQQQKQVGKVIALTYIRLGTTAVGTVAIMIYLTRPKVKEIFEER